MILPVSRRPVKIPPMLFDAIVCGISSIDKALFAHIGPCPYCGGTPAPYDTKEKIYADFEDQKSWQKKALVNIAKAGFFSSDRTIKQYNEDIWHLQ